MKTIGDLYKDAAAVRAAIERLEKDMPTHLGKVSVDHIKLNFKNESFEGDKWEQRKASTNRAYDRRGTLKGSVFNSRNPILRQTGNLYDSIKYYKRGNTIDIGISFGAKGKTGVYIVAYAKRHNEGIGKMPKRQFIGFSKNLQIKLKSKIDLEHKKAFIKFQR